MNRTNSLDIIICVCFIWLCWEIWRLLRVKRGKNCYCEGHCKNVKLLRDGEKCEECINAGGCVAELCAEVYCKKQEHKKKLK